MAYNKWFLIAVPIVIASFSDQSFSATSSSCKAVVESKVRTSAVGEKELMAKPISISTRLEVYAKSFPVLGSDGKPRKDLILYHVQKNRHYDQWMANAKAENSDKQIVDFQITTEVNPLTKKLINFLFFNERALVDPSFGTYFETIPSPELFEYQRALWNKSNDSRKQIHVRAIRRSKGDGQGDMATLWEEGYQVGIGIMDPELDNPKILRKPDPNNANVKMNTSPETFKPKLVKLPDSEKYVLEDTHHLLLHDVGQWINMLWIDKSTPEATRQVADFYVELRKIVRASGRDIAAPLHPEIRRDFKLGEPTANGIYSAHRFALDALHDSQRGVHSFTHMVLWLLEKPEGYLPGVDTANDHGPIVTGEIRNHLQGMGVKSPGAENPPIDDLNFARTWNMAKPSTQRFTLMNGLEFLINRDRERAELVGETLSKLLPEVAELYQHHKSLGTFKRVPKSELEKMAREMQWRYQYLGR